MLELINEDILGVHMKRMLGSFRQKSLDNLIYSDKFYKTNHFPFGVYVVNCLHNC